MMDFKNSKTAKVVSGFVGLATAFMMVAPGIASAATAEELQAQINALLAQVAALQASTSSSSSSSSTMTAGHQFSVDLTLGSKGDDVVALQQILVSKGHLVMPAGVSMGYFGNLTKAAVSAWQAASGITPTAGYVGPKSRAALNAMSSSSTTTTTTTTTTTSGFPAGCTSAVGYSPTTGVSCATVTPGVASGTGVSVMLDVSSPMGKTLISGQGVATLAAFKLTNAGSAAAKVTSLKLKRTGVSSDSTLNNVYLYNGTGSRLTDAASVASGMITFSDSTGLVEVPAMGSVVLAVRADLAGSTNGQTIGIMLTEATSDAGTVTGAPVSGAEMTIAAAPAGMATAQFTTLTPNGGTIDPQNDYTVWQSNVTIGSRDTLMSAIRFQQIGSVYGDDVKNFRLMVDGVQVGTSVEKADSNRFVSFNFATPTTLKAGSHVIKMVADIVGGSNRNFAFSLRRVVDVELWDSQLNIVVTPTVNVTSPALTSFPVEGSAVSVNTGTLTITKDTSSPSGNVVLSGSNVTLAKFKVRAAGEKLKVENLRVNYTGNDTSFMEIRNGALFLDGVQIGSTADLNEDTATTTYTQYNLGSSMVLDAGKDYILEVRGDIADADGSSSDSASAGDTILVNVVAGSSNVYRMSSLSYFANGTASGSTLTVAAGTASVAKYTAYANQTITVPQSAYKLGEFRVTSGNSEGLNIDTITVAVNSGTLPLTAVTNLYVVYGSKTSTSKATLATSSTFSVNEAMAANTTMNFAVYGTIDATPVSGQNLVMTLGVSGTSQSSGTAVTGTAVVGQTISVGTGSLSIALDASTPVSANVVGNSMPKVASFKFTALNDAFTITSLTATSTGSAAIAELVFKDGATEIGRQPFDGSVATKTGISVAVPYNSNKVIDVYANLGSVGTGAATSSLDVSVALVAYEKQDSNGVKTPVYNLGTYGSLVGNAFYAFKTKPTITPVALPTTALSGGSQTVAKFTVAADAGGTVSWKKIILTLATSTPSGSFQIDSYGIYDAANESTLLANVTSNGSLMPGVGTTITFTSTADQEISGSKTYVVKATVSGSPVVGSTVSHRLVSGISAYAAPVANGVVAGSPAFTWSDESVLGHSLTTNDWFNDFLVKNIPTDSQTMTK